LDEHGEPAVLTLRTPTYEVCSVLLIHSRQHWNEMTLRKEATSILSGTIMLFRCTSPLQLNCGNTSTLSRFRSLGTKMEEEKNKGGDRQTDRQTHSTCLSLSSITSHFSFRKQQTFHRSTLRKPKNQAPVCVNHFPPLTPPFLKQHKSPQRIALIPDHSIQRPSKTILIPRRLIAESLSNSLPLG
jgi:hypothetical protein